MTAEEIRRAIQRSSLAGEVERMMGWVRPAVRMRTSRIEESDLTLGASRMGGMPDLPPDVPWPRHKGRPLEFLAQIDMAAASRAFALPDLPTRGWLIVFLNIDALFDLHLGDRGAWSIAHFEAAVSTLVRREQPGWIEYRYNLCELTFEHEDCLPDPSDQMPEFGTWVHGHADAYRNLVSQLGPDNREWHHRLGGYPMLIQTGPSAAERRKWDFVLQIDTDEKVGWQWVDTGRLYYWTKRASRPLRPFGGGFGGRLQARFGAKRRWAGKFADSWCFTEFY